MKNVNLVFDEHLKSLIDMTSIGNLRGCFFISSNMSMYCCFSDYPDGVLISEVLESVFSQIGPMLDEINESEKIQLIEEIQKPLQLIIKHYLDSNKNDLYAALRDIRTIATNIQIRCLRGDFKEKIQD